MYQHILVGTDGSATADRAVQRAVEVARTTGASLTIMTAARVERGRQILEAAVQQHGSDDVALDTLVVDDDAVSAIIDTARTGGYDLVVVGNKGMTGPSRFFHLGGVPNKLSHQLPTSMLIVRTT